MIKIALLLSVAAGLSCQPLLLVLNKDDATLAFVDPASGKVTARVGVGEGPHEMTVSTDRKFAFVGNYGSRTPGSTISVIDIKAQKETRRVDLGALRRPHGIVFADGKVYFTAEQNKLIARYDPAANQVDWLLGTGQNSTHMLLFSRDGNLIFTANIGSNSITAIDLPSFNETVIPVGKGPEGMDLSPDGKELWVAHSQDGEVSVIDVATKKVKATLNPATKRSNRIKFTPDGKLVLITDLTAGELLIWDAVGHHEVKRLKLGRSPEGILIVPDGSRAYIGVAGENHVAVIDLKTLAITGELSTGNGPDGMAWVQ